MHSLPLFPKNSLSSRLFGTDRDDRITGTAADDEFVFETNAGHDVLTGFKGGAGRGDVMVFRTSAFANLSDLLGHATQQGADVILTVDQHTSLLIKSMMLANLNADDFRFVA